MADDIFAADPQAVIKGGQMLRDAHTGLSELHSSVQLGHSALQIQGNGSVEESLRNVYEKAAVQLLDMMKTLGTVIETHGAATGDMGDIFATTNDAATSIAVNGGRTH